MFNNQEIIQTAMRQSVLDINAAETDFSDNSNVIVKSEIPIMRISKRYTAYGFV